MNLFYPDVTTHAFLPIKRAIQQLGKDVWQYCQTQMLFCREYGAMKLANHSSGRLLPVLQEVTPFEIEWFRQNVIMRMENDNLMQ